MELNLAVSIVLYKNDIKKVVEAIDSALNSSLVTKLYIIDNSPYESHNCLKSDKRIEYIFLNGNKGFGKGHNISLQKTIESKFKYHLVMNPDVYFNHGTLENLFNFMEQNPDIGLIMPKIKYPDGSIQYLCKLLPSPFDLIRRRFLPQSTCFDKKDEFYELRFTGYDKIMDVPYLSGCFMFIRTEAIARAGLFDERFFLYLEDVDFCRRIHKYYRTVYYPFASVFHQYSKGSYKNMKLLICHLSSAIKYFFKWGFIFDSDRRKINETIIQKLTKKL